MVWMKLLVLLTIATVPWLMPRLTKALLASALDPTIIDGHLSGQSPATVPVPGTTVAVPVPAPQPVGRRPAPAVTVMPFEEVMHLSCRLFVEVGSRTWPGARLAFPVACSKLPLKT